MVSDSNGSDGDDPEGLELSVYFSTQRSYVGIIRKALIMHGDIPTSLSPSVGSGEEGNIQSQNTRFQTKRLEPRRSIVDELKSDPAPSNGFNWFELKGCGSVKALSSFSGCVKIQYLAKYLFSRFSSR